MAELRIALPHQLGKAEALKRSRSLLAKVKSEHGDQIENLQEQWNDNGARFSFKVPGPFLLPSSNISGEFLVTDTNVTITGNISGLAEMVADQIENRIRDEATRLLA